MSVIEKRALPHGEIRAIEEDGEHFVELQIVRYGVVDDYGSVWLPGCFTESLNTRMPTLCWGHNWEYIIGRGVSWSDATDGPVVRFRFSDFDAVPLARQAFSQVSRGEVDDCSVGFSNVERREPTPDEQKQYPGVREFIVKADEDETSLVLRGAVPGAKVLAARQVRAPGGMVDENLVITIAKKVASGELTKEEGIAALDLAAVPEPPKDEEPKAEVDPPEEVEVVEDTTDYDAEMEEALALVKERLDA